MIGDVNESLNFRPKMDFSYLHGLKIAFTIAIIFMLVMVTCQMIVTNASGQEVIRVFQYGANEVLDNANPYIGYLEISYVFYGMIYNDLVTLDEDFQKIPNLAQSWWRMDGVTASTQLEPTDFQNTNDFPTNNSPADWPYGSIWEFNLSEHIFWNDGTPFTADDVEWTLEIQIGDNWMIYWAYQPSTIWIHHVEKVNDYKVRIFYNNFITKNPISISFAEYQAIPIMPKHIFEFKSPTFLAYEYDGIPAIGTGPFMGTPNLRNEVIGKEFVTLVRNPYYNFVDPVDGIRKGLGGINNRTIEIDKMVMKMFSDMNTLHLAVETGQVDTAIIEPGTYIQWKSRKENGTLPKEIELVNMFPSRGFSKQACFNAYPDAPGILSTLRLDPAVLRAASLATNKELLINSVYKGMGIPGTGIIATPAWPEWYWEPGDKLSWFNLTDGNGDIIPEGSYSKPMKEVMGYDLELANQILTAAGYEWTGTPGESVRKATRLVGERLAHLGFLANPDVVIDETLEFEMVIAISEEDDRRVGQFLTPEWRKIGLYLNEELVDDPTWDRLVYSYTFNTMITYWSGDYDPNYLCFIPTTMSLWGWNEFGTTDPEYDELFLKQAQAETYDERKYWVDKCSEWQYLSGSILTYIYPKISYAYRTDSWTNWGDWENHSGLGIDFFWSEAPIWERLQYVSLDDDSDGDDNWPAIIAIIGTIAAISAALVWMSHMRKVKRERRLEEEYEEEEEK